MLLMHALLAKSLVLVSPLTDAKKCISSAKSEKQYFMDDQTILLAYASLLLLK